MLTQVSRYDMLADRNDSALQVGRQALKMAEQLGLDDIRAHALNNIGGARMAAGDPDGTEDLEESIALATRLSSISDMIRGYNNLGAMNLALGRLERARTEVLESYRLAMHFGHHGYARWSSGGPLLSDALQRGRWDELVTGADSFLADVGGGSLRARIGIEIDCAVVAWQERQSPSGGASSQVSPGLVGLELGAGIAYQW